MSRLLIGLIPLLVAFPVVLIVRMVRPFVLIRFGSLPSDRIGHFAPETELYLCEREQGIHGDRGLDLFYYNGLICNRQLAKMWSRTIFVTRFARWPDVLNRHIPGGEKHVIPRRTVDRIYDIHGVLETTPARLTFTQEEEQLGQQALERMGIPEGAPFVCFAARDTAYLKSLYPNYDFRYHDHRNSMINDYLAAAKAMVDRGYHAIRMGAVTAANVDSSCPRIIDYATNGSRNDFLDIYLSAKCRLFICSADGIAAIPLLFRRPILMVNFVPIGAIWNWSGNSLCIPKKLWLQQERRLMSFREIYDSGAHQFYETEQYERLGIEVVENTPEEIAAVAVEMDERLNGHWQTTQEDEELQSRFWSMHKSCYAFVTIKSRIGAEFLRQNQHLLD